MRTVLVSCLIHSISIKQLFCFPCLCTVLVMLRGLQVIFLITVPKLMQRNPAPIFQPLPWHSMYQKWLRSSCMMVQIKGFNLHHQRRLWLNKSNVRQGQHIARDAHEIVVGITLTAIVVLSQGRHSIVEQPVTLASIGLLAQLIAADCIRAAKLLLHLKQPIKCMLKNMQSNFMTANIHWNLALMTLSKKEMKCNAATWSCFSYMMTWSITSTQAKRTL